MAGVEILSIIAEQAALRDVLLVLRRLVLMACAEQ
jgi:hypothetical protein